MSKKPSSSSSCVPTPVHISSVISSLRSRWDRRRSIPSIRSAPASAATQQQFRDECDMNKIVANAQRGIPPRWLARGVPRYGDFSEIPDLATAFNMIQEAREAFLTLPSGLRSELGNDPARINELTPEQLSRYKLLKADQAVSSPSPAGTPPVPASAPGQGAPGGVPASPETKPE